MQKSFTHTNTSKTKKFFLAISNEITAICIFTSPFPNLCKPKKRETRFSLVSKQQNTLWQTIAQIRLVLPQKQLLMVFLNMILQKTLASNSELTVIACGKIFTKVIHLVNFWVTEQVIFSTVSTLRKGKMQLEGLVGCNL